MQKEMKGVREGRKEGKKQEQKRKLYQNRENILTFPQNPAPFSLFTYWSITDIIVSYISIYNIDIIVR